MQADFDIAAQPYDDIFTNSIIGKRQRKKVWTYLEKVISTKKKLHILELNCGTGEDALFFAQKGHQVLATDLSTEMLAVAKQKIAASTHSSKVYFQQIDIGQIDKISFPQKFDLVFSNFGGLNCLNKTQLTHIAPCIQQLLNKNGHFIAVLMPKHCLLESVYFLAKGQFSKAFRRNTDTAVAVNLHETKVATWYFSPTDFFNCFQRYFNQKSSLAVGMIPSYLEFLLQKNKWLKMSILSFANFLFWFSQKGKQADHYLIHLQAS